MEPSFKEKISDNELKDFLDFKANQYENPNFVESDPIQIPKKYKRKEDTEIVAFLIATIAWGNRKSIIKSGEKLMSILGESPYDFILTLSTSKIKFTHRTFNEIDLTFFLQSLQNIYQNHNGLEACFNINSNQEKDLYHRIIRFRNIFISIQHQSRSLKHLANPMSGSACKRLIMFLRWMVRSSEKGVDFGLWKSIHPNELMIPLDVHTGNISRKLMLLNRKQNDWSSNIELRKTLIKFDPQDPAKYDFALFGLGAFENF